LVCLFHLFVEILVHLILSISETPIIGVRMQLNTSYRQILSISTPIMLGSAVQNIIALSDSVFLYHLSEIDFAAIGFVGVF